MHTLPELKAFAKKHGIVACRSDGSKKAPLKQDYIDAIKAAGRYAKKPLTREVPPIRKSKPEVSILELKSFVKKYNINVVRQDGSGKAPLKKDYSDAIGKWRTKPVPKKEPRPEYVPKHTSSPRKTHSSPPKVTPEMIMAQKKAFCEVFLKDNNIVTKKDWYNWLRKNHPDHNPNITDEMADLVKMVIECNSEVMGW